jgi:ribulose-5-phosphate 4-epimerase/fuculose-1-phosphate aldolase
MNEQTLRIELTAVLRWAARLGMQEGISNHFSAAVSADGRQFLLSPNARFWSRVKASDLLLLDVDDPDVFGRPDAPDPTAWHLHAHLHQVVPHARCVLHSHMPYATALCLLQNYELQMIDQNACRFFGRIVYDRNYGGMAFREESERIAKSLTPSKAIVMLGNHGVLAIGETVAAAFDELYYLEMACRVQVHALSTQQPLAVLSDEIAQKTCDEWLEYPALTNLHLREIMATLDDEEANYRD